MFRDNEELFAEIKEKIVEAVCADITARELAYPAVMEKSFKSTEDAAKYPDRLRADGISADYPECDILGKDAHTVVSRIFGIDDLILGI